jgi:hypothetical protein
VKFAGWIKRSEYTESSLWLRRHNKEQEIKDFGNSSINSGNPLTQALSHQGRGSKLIEIIK